MTRSARCGWGFLPLRRNARIHNHALQFVGLAVGQAMDTGRISTVCRSILAHFVYRRCLGGAFALWATAPAAVPAAALREFALCETFGQRTRTSVQWPFFLSCYDSKFSVRSGGPSVGSRTSGNCSCGLLGGREYSLVSSTAAARVFHRSSAQSQRNPFTHHSRISFLYDSFQERHLSPTSVSMMIILLRLVVLSAR